MSRCGPLGKLLPLAAPPLPGPGDQSNNQLPGPEVRLERWAGSQHYAPRYAGQATIKPPPSSLTCQHGIMTGEPGAGGGWRLPQVKPYLQVPMAGRLEQGKKSPYYCLPAENLSFHEPFHRSAVQASNLHIANADNEEEMKGWNSYL